MKALLLSAGYGKRLGNITKTIPKCLLKVKEKPILEIWIEKLIILNIEEIFVNTYYLADQVETFLEKFSRQKVKITILKETKLLGTAGTLYKNLSLFQDTDLLMAHTDNYFEDDLFNLFLAHKNRLEECNLTMMTFDTATPSSCGIVEIDKNNIVIKYEEKPKFSKLTRANGAIFILSKDFLTNFSKDKKDKDFCKDILPKYIYKIQTYHTNKKFFDIGTKEVLDEINEIN